MVAQANTLSYLLKKLPNKTLNGCGVCVCVVEGELSGEGAKERIFLSFHKDKKAGGGVTLVMEPRV